MTLETAEEVGSSFNLYCISTDIKMDYSCIVTLNYVSKLLESIAREIVLTEVYLRKFFVIFENLCYH